MSLVSYKELHIWMDDIEDRVNDRLQELTVPDLARFVDELVQDHADIIQFHERSVEVFLISNIKES